MTTIQTTPKTSDQTCAASTPRFRRTLLCGAIIATLSGTMISQTAIAQAQPNQAVEVAAQENKQAFAIPAGSLEQALLKFSSLTGITVSFTPESVKGHSTQGANGQFTTAQALAALLQGTNLSAQAQSGGSYTIEVPSDGVMMLGAVKVGGDGIEETAYGPVEGYVAKRSATGSRIDTPLIEIPRSISVVTADEIEARGGNSGNIPETLRYTPGLVAEPRGLEVNRTEFTIRGFRAEDVIYRDGLKGHGQGAFNAGATNIDTYGVERIEVLRGPASALYGQGPTGGLVNLVTKRPREEFFAEAEVNTGSFNQHSGRFDVGGAINDEGEFLYRMTGLIRESDSQIDHLDTSRTYLAPALTWRATPQTTVTFLGQYQSDNAYGIQYVLANGSIFDNPNGKFSSSSYNGEPDFERYDTEYFSLGYIVDHNFSESFSINHKSRLEHYDFLGNVVLRVGMQADNRTLDREAIFDTDVGDLFSTDTNVQIKYSSEITKSILVAGLDYKLAENDFYYSFGVAPSQDAFSPVFGQPVTDSSSIFVLDTHNSVYQAGIYIQNQTKILDRWVLTFGGRQDWTGSDAKDKLTNTTKKRHDNAFTGQAGLSYLFDNGIAPYISYAESFEPQSGTDRQGKEFVPTTGTQYEIGIKYEPTEYNSLMTISAFELTRQNLTAADPVDNNFEVQTGEVRSRGIEAQVKASLNNNIGLVASYTYTDVVVTKSDYRKVGSKQDGVPKNAASLWVDYEISTGSFNGFGIGGGVRYLGSTLDWGNIVKTPDVTLLDAEAHYDMKAGQFEDVRFSITANNLLDKEYLTACSSYACFFGARRNVTASVKYSW